MSFSHFRRIGLTLVLLVACSPDPTRPNPVDARDAMPRADVVTDSALDAAAQADVVSRPAIPVGPEQQPPAGPQRCFANVVKNGGTLITDAGALRDAAPAPDATHTGDAMATADARSDAASDSDAALTAHDATPSAPSSGSALDAGPTLPPLSDPDARPEAPALISETGCFADTASHTPAKDLIRYALVAPLWTDGAHKERFFSLPEGTHIQANADGSWDWPAGSVIVKMFAFDLADEAKVTRRPLETRIMKKFEDGTWRYWSYAWNEEATDAVLLAKSKDVLADLVVDKSVESVIYHYPSESTCQACHGLDNVGILGPTAEQLNLEVESGGRTQNQLELLRELGALQGATPPTTPLVNPADETAPIEARARSYLHANCAHCHRPNGYAPLNVAMDLRITTPLKDAELCGTVASYPGGGGTYRIAPGNLEDSNLWRRFTSDGLERMPLVGTKLHDPLGEAVLKAWILSLKSCP